jgi:chromosome segregation ATPase
LERERAALAETSENRREELRRQASAQLTQEAQQLREEFSALRGAVLEFGMKQAGTDGESARLQKTLEEIRSLLARPEKARDEILQGLEGEKRDLMQALRERTGQLHNYVLERREIERTLGESLMEMSRNLETERDAHRKTRERIAVLEQAIEALKAEGELRGKELFDRQARIAQSSAERDELLKALTEESEKVRRQISERTAGDRAWEEKVLELQKSSDEERGKRMQAEQSCADARAQMQALTDHISRLIREKDAVEGRFTDWERQRREMDDQLHKKDEMLGMLSTTFRNILKKPSDS